MKEEAQDDHSLTKYKVCAYYWVDASKPKPNESQNVTVEELKSIQGFYITHMGVPYIGGSTEKREEATAPVLPKSNQLMKEFKQSNIYDIS